jgi:hypothetical protein
MSKANKPKPPAGGKQPPKPFIDRIMVSAATKQGVADQGVSIFIMDVGRPIAVYLDAEDAVRLSTALLAAVALGQCYVTAPKVERL